MDYTLDLPVFYKGIELLFPAEIIRYGYVHRILINVDGQFLYIEKDEEGNYRAIVDDKNTKELDRGLVQAIVLSVETLLK